jgi:F-type H+-transporting ATPase subunit gamma
MAENVERAQTRLSNIRSVQPLLGALRTISLGSWQSALKQQQTMKIYRQKFAVMLAALTPLLAARKNELPRNWGWASSVRLRKVAIVIGSERGLVGRFNNAVLAHTTQYLNDQHQAESEVRLWVLGSRPHRVMERRGQKIDWFQPLTTTALPSFEQAFAVIRRCTLLYEAEEIDAVDILYNTYRSAGMYRSATVSLIPPQIDFEGNHSVTTYPPIIETDPFQLYARVIEQIVTIGFYERLLESAAAEHSSRFQLMEDATRNADRLIEEVTQNIQQANKQAITQEMQELAAGAGLTSS